MSISTGSGLQQLMEGNGISKIPILYYYIWYIISGMSDSLDPQCHDTVEDNPVDLPSSNAASSPKQVSPSNAMLRAQALESLHPIPVSSSTPSKGAAVNSKGM